MTSPLPERHEIVAFISSRPVAVSMLVLAVMVFGLISMGRLPLTLMPDISYPSITLRSEWEGAAPEEVEQFVSRPIEQAMGVVSGKVSITSLSRAGQSDVVVEFGWDTDMDLAIQDCREKLEMVRLPEDAERPLILRYDPSLDPVMRLGLSWKDAAGDEASLRSLRRLAEDQIKFELEKLPGIAAVKVRGGLEEEIRVELNESELSLRGLDIQSITRQLAVENVNLAGGNLKEGRTEYVVRVLSEFRSLDDIGDTRLRTADGTWIRLADIAEIRRAGRDPDALTRVQGRPAVEVEIHKEADANVVQVAKQLRLRLFGPAGQPAQTADSTKEAKANRGRGGNRQEKAWWLAATVGEAGARIDLLSDQSTFIDASLRELRSSALTGGLLAVLILFLFLRNVAATAMVALAIPLSIIATFGPMQLAGLSLNVMSLGGLALGIGMLVDNAIVVLESIHRCREEGDDRLRAAVRGTGEVAQAVIASTLTTVAVFFPMVFVEGVAGQVFGDLALVVVFSLSASLLLALTFLPTLAALGARGRREDGHPAFTRSRSLLLAPPECWLMGKRRFLRLKEWWKAGPLLRLLPAMLALVLLLFRILLQLLIDFYARLLLLALVLLMQVVRLLRWLGRALLGWLGGLLEKVASGPVGHVPQLYQRLLSISLLRPTLPLLLVALFLGMMLVLTPRLGRELMPAMHQGEFHVEALLPVGTPLELTAERLEALEAFLAMQPEVAGYSLVVGKDTQGGIDTEGGEHMARLTVRLKASDNPALQEDALQTRLRPFLATLPEVESRIAWPVLFSFKTPIEIHLFGHDLDELKQRTAQLLDRLEALPGLADLHAGAASGNPEIHVLFDREALGRLGLNLQTVAEALRNMVLGDVETEYRDVDQRIDLRVRLRSQDLMGLDDIRRLVINPGESKAIPLSAVAEVKLAEGPAEIRRVEQERCSVIRANLAGSDLGTVLGELKSELAGMNWTRDQSWELVGQSQEMERSLNSLYMALALAIFLVYVVMASQFESLLHPLVILIAVPLAFVGVVPGLWLLNVPVSVLVFLGAIMLVGIVVNNAIILVDTINLQRSRGLERHTAILKAGELRLRPILMTTATTVLGLLPLALGLGEGSEMRRPMALTVILGLATSTLLTLIVIPVIYDRLERLLDLILPGREGKKA
jgi:HAE1 family hydrophobic/amphiphilic exporter-1